MRKKFPTLCYLSIIEMLTVGQFVCKNEDAAAGVAQLVRALDCGSRGRRFDPDHSPQECGILPI